VAIDRARLLHLVEYSVQTVANRDLGCVHSRTDKQESPLSIASVYTQLLL